MSTTNSKPKIERIQEKPYFYAEIDGTKHPTYAAALAHTKHRGEILKLQDMLKRVVDPQYGHVVDRIVTSLQTNETYITNVRDQLNKVAANIRLRKKNKATSK